MICKIVTNIVFWDKKSNNTTTTKQKIKHKTLDGAYRTHSRCVTSASPSQLRVTIVVKLFNCFDAMG